MTKFFRKWTNVVLALALMISMITIPVIPAGAKEVKPGIPEEAITMPYPSTMTRGVSVTGLEKNAKVSVKSSNKSIVQVTYNKQYKSISLKAKKAGKATITCKVTQGGKSYTTTSKVTVYKYTNPVTLLKVGNTNYTSKYNKTQIAYTNKNINGQKLQIKAKKGYKVDSIYTYGVSARKTLKNGSKLTLKKGDAVGFAIIDPKGTRVFIHLSNMK